MGTLGIVDLNALGFDHDEPGIDTLDFGDELLLADGPSLWLLYYLELQIR